MITIGIRIKNLSRLNFTLYDTFEKSHLSQPCFSSILRGDRQTVMDIRPVFFQLREQNWNELFKIERNEWSEWKNKIKCEKKGTKEDIMTYYYERESFSRYQKWS